MKGQQVITCPNCGENKVSMIPLDLAFIITGLIWLLFPVAYIVTPLLIMLGVALMFSGRTFKCKACKHMFSVKLKKYKEYKQAIKRT